MSSNGGISVSLSEEKKSKNMIVIYINVATSHQCFTRGARGGLQLRIFYKLIFFACDSLNSLWIERNHIYSILCSGLQ